MKFLLLAFMEIFASDFPRRDYSIIAGPIGFFPSSIWAYPNETINIFFTAVQDRSCMIIKGRDFILSGKLGQISEGKIKFDRPGKYEFYCPTGNISGMIHILSKGKV